MSKRDETFGRRVGDCMIYVVFVRIQSLQTGFKLVRYADASRIQKGIEKQKAEGWEPHWAIQGRQRNLESLEEGS